MVLRLADIAAPITPLSVSATAQAALQRFLSEPDLHAVPILSGKANWQLLARNSILEVFARPGAHAEMGQQPAASLATRRAAVVDGRAPAATIAARAVKARSSALQNGLIVQADGQYAGYVSPQALLAAVSNENVTRAKAMNAARTAIADAERQQSEFLALVGHEIRTPLTGVLGLADLLLEAKMGDKPRAYARSISQSGDHLKRILDDLLDASRLKAGKLTIEPHAFDLKAFAADIEQFWRGGIEGRPIALSARVEKGSVRRIEADEARLRQIAFNLVSNALKFTETGDVQIRVGTEVDADENVLLSLCVADTGLGIDAADKSRLFEAFERADDAATQDGVGLGLFIARSLSSQMSGSITLADNEGGGTVFTVTVPVKKAGPRLAVENPEPPRQRIFELGRLLLVEDHEITRFVMEKSLSAAGWQVDAVHTGAQAQRRAATIPYQAILSDLRLPDLDGEDLVRDIRNGGGPNAGAPVLAVTADVSATRLNQAIAAGFDSIVEKPVRPRALVTTLADVILSHEDATPVRRLSQL